MLLGTGGLQLVDIDAFSLHQMLFLTAGLGVGFQVGLHAVWPAHAWRTLGLVAVVTALAFAAVTTITTLLGLPLEQAVLLGALASLWGPFTGVPEFGRARARWCWPWLGSGCALVALGGALIWLEIGAEGWVGRVVLSLVAGGGLGLGLRFFRSVRHPECDHSLRPSRSFFLSGSRAGSPRADGSPLRADGGIGAKQAAKPPRAVAAAPGRAGRFHALFRTRGDRARPRRAVASRSRTVRGRTRASGRTVAFAGVGPHGVLPAARFPSRAAHWLATLAARCVAVRVVLRPARAGSLRRGWRSVGAGRALGHFRFDPALLLLIIARRCEPFRGGKGSLLRRQRNGLSAPLLVCVQLG